MADTALTPAREAHAAELAGYRDVDAHVLRIAGRMAQGDWERGKAAREYAATYGISESRVDNWAAEAARHLRLLGDLQGLKTKALLVADQVLSSDAEPMRLAAAKLILERVEARGPGSSAPASVSLEAVFADPPPELRRLLLAWLTRVAGGEDAEVVGVIEASGWRRE